MSPSDRIGDDRLREILAGCEGVTAGPMLDPQTVSSIVSELLSHRERLAYRHDELVEAVSRPTKEPAHGK